MYVIYIITGTALLISLAFSLRKTIQAIKIAITRFINIVPEFLIMLIFISIILFIIPDSIIVKYLGSSNNLSGMIFASLFGSISLLPGFIAFPLSGILLQKGVQYMVLAAFTTTLMMVGIVTFPLEKKYFGARIAVIRNILGLITALAVSIVIGILYGEIF